MPRLKLAFALQLFIVASLAAQEKREDVVKKQIASAMESLKTAGIKAGAVETPEMIIFTTAPETRAKAIAATAQKTYDYTYKYLKFGDDDKLWPGKLTIYYLPERKDFTSFMRIIEQRKPDAKETLIAKVTGNEPYILLSQEAGIKITDAEVGNTLGEAIAKGMLDYKALVKPAVGGLPQWLSSGFARAMLLRADGNATKLTAHRAKVKTYFTKAKLPTFKASDMWANTSMKDWDTLSTSLVEHLMATWDADKFKKFIRGLAPSDPNALPTIETILTIMDLTPDSLDANWKAWVAKQK
jgi:hypothetical protein